MTRSGKRGFGNMDPEKQRAIARKGGSSVPADRRSFSADKTLASRAGRKGGLAGRRKKRSNPVGGSDR